MKLPSRTTVGKVLGGVVILALLYLYYVVPVPTTRVRTQASSSTTPSATVPPTTSTTTSTPTVTATPSVDRYGAIIGRSVAIVQAYYLLYPSDTAASRQARITAKVSASVMTTPDFSVGSVSCQDQVRIQKSLTEHATVTPASVQVELILKDPYHVSLRIPGKVNQYLPSGQLYAGNSSCPSSWPFAATFQWQQKQGVWSLVHFGNPGLSP